MENHSHGAEPFLRRCQLCSYSRTSQHFMEPKGNKTNTEKRREEKLILLINLPTKKYILVSYIMNLSDTGAILNRVKILQACKSYLCNRPWRPWGCEKLRLPHSVDN
jgi:hypothetical protein